MGKKTFQVTGSFILLLLSWHLATITPSLIHIKETESKAVYVNNSSATQTTSTVHLYVLSWNRCMNFKHRLPVFALSP
jgi:hypothetical protein